MFRLLRWLYRSVPLPEKHKESIKHAIYPRLGFLFVGRPNHAVWLRQQAALPRLPSAPPPAEPSDAQWSAIVERRANSAPDVALEGCPSRLLPDTIHGEACEAALLETAWSSKRYVSLVGDYYEGFAL